MNQYMENKIIGIIELNSELNKTVKKENFAGKNEKMAGRKGFWHFIG